MSYPALVGFAIEVTWVVFFVLTFYTVGGGIVRRLGKASLRSWGLRDWLRVAVLAVFAILMLWGLYFYAQWCSANYDACSCCG